MKPSYQQGFLVLLVSVFMAASSAKGGSRCRIKVVWVSKVAFFLNFCNRMTEPPVLIQMTHRLYWQ